MSNEATETASNLTASSQSTTPPTEVSIEICPTVLLTDEPAKKDWFKPQEMVALAMTKLIENTVGGKAIGLEGGWGSGKTSIINLLTDKLENTKNTVVLFDAWAHEGDPLRRTFLESLIDHFINIGWFGSDAWSDDKEILGRRLELKNTITVPNLTRAGIAVLIATPFIPVGIAFLNAALREPPTTIFVWNLQIATRFLSLFVIGLVLTFLPLLVVVFEIARQWLMVQWDQIKLRRRVIGSGRRQKENESAPGTKAVGPNGNQRERRQEAKHTWTLFLNKSFSESRIETNKTPNPTSIEFEEEFCKIMGAALDPPDRKVVLVLDNLDRIGANEALAIWSTLQTFLRPRTIKGRDIEWLDRLWVIMPFDPEALRRLWGERHNSDSKPTTHSGKPTPNEGTKWREQEQLALSFLDKSFQIRFEVPPPALSDWHIHLLELLGRALPEHKVSLPTDREADFHACYRLYAWHKGEDKTPPTPRALKLFVNQIGAFHRLWGDELSLAHIAYYTLLRRRNSQVIQELMEGNLPNEELQGLLGEGAADNLAALALNVKPHQAKQIILGSPINRAIAARDPKEISRLEKKHRDNGFWEILEQIAQEEWSRAGISTVADAAYCLASSGLLSDRNHPPVRQVKNILVRAAGRENSIWPMNVEIAQGLTELFRLDPTSAVVTHVLIALGTGLAQPGRAPADLSSWVNSVNLFLSGLQNLGLAADVNQCFELPFADRFRDEFGTANLDILHALCDPLVSKLSGSAAVPAGEAYTAYEALCRFSAAENARAAVFALKYLAEDGHTLYHFGQVANQESASATAILLYAFLSQLRDPAKSKTIGNSTLGAGYVQQILAQKAFGNSLREELISEFPERFQSWSEKFGQPLVIFTILDEAPSSKPFVTACLIHLAKASNAPELISPSLLSDRWQLIEETLGTEVEELVNRLSDVPQWLDQLTFIKFNESSAGMYSALASSSRACAHSGFQSWIRSTLESVDGKVWSYDIFKVGPLTETVRRLMLEDVEISLGEGYQDALVDHGKALAEGTVSATPVTGYDLNWSRLSRAFTQGRAEALLAELYDHTTKLRGAIHHTFFDVWGKSLIEEARRRDRNQLVSELLTPMLQKRNERGIRWFSAIISPDEISEFLGACSSTTRVDLARALRALNKESLAILGDFDAALVEQGKARSFIDGLARALSASEADRVPIVGLKVWFHFNRTTVCDATITRVIDLPSKLVDLEVHLSVGSKAYPKVRYDSSLKGPGTYRFELDELILPTSTPPDD